MDASPFTFPLCSQYQEVNVPFFFHIDIELSYEDNCLIFLLASLGPVSSRPWPIFLCTHTHTQVHSIVLGTNPAIYNTLQTNLITQIHTHIFLCNVLSINMYMSCLNFFLSEVKSCLCSIICIKPITLK